METLSLLQLLSKLFYALTKQMTTDKVFTYDQFLQLLISYPALD